MAVRALHSPTAWTDAGAPLKGSCALLNPISSLEDMVGVPTHVSEEAQSYGGPCLESAMALLCLRLSLVMGWCRCTSKAGARSLPPSP